MGTARNMLGLVGWLVISLVAGWTGSRYTPGAWYASLTKPAWTPPDALFPPVWTVLYVLMGLAAWLVWRREGFTGAAAALICFLIQLSLNALWSYLFFGLHRTDLAFFEIVVLWVMILVVGVLFWREDWRAGALMIPYWLWVGFASCLNFALWRLNAGPKA
ncbi:MAG: TspO/MBR family protein [Acidobacteriota bacterium]